MCPPFFGGTGVNKSFYLAASARRPLKGQHGTDFIGIGFGLYAIVGDVKIYIPDNFFKFFAAPIRPGKLLSLIHICGAIQLCRHHSRYIIDRYRDAMHSA